MQKVYFFKLAYIFFISQDIKHTSQMANMILKALLYTNISLKYITTNLPIKFTQYTIHQSL